MVRFLLASLALHLLAGCDLAGNGQRYPGTSVYQAPDEGFHFHFISPPWRYHVKDPKHLLHLVVDSYSQFNRSEGEEVTISHKLWVQYGSGSPQAALTLLRNKALAAGKTIDRDTAELETLTGEQGWEYVAHKDEDETGRFYYRDAALDDDNGRTVLFTMMAAYPLDVQDIDDLLRSFSHGPDDGTEVPRRKFDGSQPPSPPDLGGLDAGADGGPP